MDLAGLTTIYLWTPNVPQCPEKLPGRVPVCTSQLYALVETEYIDEVTSNQTHNFFTGICV